MRIRVRVPSRLPVLLLLVMLCCGAGGARVGLAGEGDPDTAFSTDGKAILGWSEIADAYAVTALGNGDLLVAGRVQGGAWLVARFDDDGVLDPVWAQNSDPFDFGAEGVFLTADLYAVGSDSLGRTRIAGVVAPDDTFDTWWPAVARLAPSGVLDATFDGNGRKTVPVPLSWTFSLVVGAEILPDGRTYFLGVCTGCSPGKGGTGIFVLRLDANGNPDPTFSGDGWATYGDDLLSLRADAMSVQPDGSVTAACTAQFQGQQLGVLTIRWTASGDLDLSFSDNGVGELVDLDTGTPVDLVVNPESERIAVAIQTNLPSDGDGLLGLTAQGARDPQFGDQGWVDLDLEEGTELAAIELQSDGKIVAGATIDANGTQPAGFLVARLHDDGAFDDSYDDNGVNRVEFDLVADGQDIARAATLSSGRLVVVGYAEEAVTLSDMAVLRIETALIFHDGFERGDASGWAP